MSERWAERALHPRALELGKTFLSTLFMAVRTAKVHDAQNRAFDRAVETVREAADALYAAVGRFTVQYVEDVLFLNGTRIRFEGASLEAMHALREILQQHALGGLELRQPPSSDSTKKLILLLAQGPAPGVTAPQALAELQLGAVGARTFADLEPESFQAELDVFAAQIYAKLILCLREQRVALDLSRGAPGRPRLRAVRVMQDLADVAEQRLDYLIRLGMNRKGASLEDLHGPNVALLSMAMGYALGLRRQALVDLGLGGLLHDVGRPEGDLDSALHPHTAISFAWLFHEGTMSRSMLMRSVIAAEHHYRPTDTLPWGRPLPQPNLFSRIVSVVEGFESLSSGLACDDGKPLETLEALRVVRDDPGGRFDPLLVDVLMNLLRAYPVGTRVVLADGRLATVRTHAGGSRWDRPIVLAEGDPPTKLDLMVRVDNRFQNRIVSTALAVLAG